MLAVPAALLVAFLALAGLVAAGWPPLMHADRQVESAVHRFVLGHAGVLDTARALTHLGDPLVVTVLTGLAALALLAVRRSRAAAYLVGVRVAIVVLDWGLKAAVGRSRPDLPDPVAHAHGGSFPSGHAAGSAALWCSLALVVGDRWPPWSRVTVAVLPPVAVASTRVLLGRAFRQ